MHMMHTLLLLWRKGTTVAAVRVVLCMCYFGSPSSVAAWLVVYTLTGLGMALLKLLLLTTPPKAPGISHT